MSPRTLYQDSVYNEVKKDVPGPGFYPVTQSFSETGKYVNSLFTNSRAPKLSPSARFREI